MKFNQITNEDEFIPNLFMEPMRSAFSTVMIFVVKLCFAQECDRISRCGGSDAVIFGLCGPSPH